MFKQVTIIGFGLIGSSLAHAIRRGNLAEAVICGDRSQEVCDIVLQDGLADEAYTNLAKAVDGSDVIVISVPVGAIADVAKEIASSIKDGALVTDTGSVKNGPAMAMDKAFSDKVQVVPGHPIAGTEYSGPRAGFAELFDGRWCILTPLAHTDIRAVERATQFWEGCGATIELMDPQHHDLVLGITSHLPHLIAYTIVGTATDLEDDIKGEVIKFSASGFRDFTRIAASDPVMWRDVFLQNKDAVLEILQRFTEDLTAMQRAIRKGDGEYLYKTFETTRDIRRAIIDAGQADYAYPSGKGAGVPVAKAPPTKAGQKS